MNATSLFACGSIITFPNRKFITFDNPIWKVELLTNVVSVLLEAPKSAHINNRNVISFSIEGELLWQIDDARKYLYAGASYCPFVDIDTAALHGHPEQLMLYNWCEIALRVAPATGEILAQVRTK